MTILSIEERLTKLEHQMQKRIDRQNLLAELLYKQAQLQKINLDLLMASVGELPPELAEELAQFFALVRKAYQEMENTLDPDDFQAREYIHSLQNLLKYKS